MYVKSWRKWKNWLVLLLCGWDYLLIWKLVQKRELKAYRAIPCLVLWGIWLAHNDSLFNGIQKPTFQVFSQVNGLFNGDCKMDQKGRIPRQVGELMIDKTIPWGFFDGAKQDPQNFCSFGGVLFLSEKHFFKFKAGLDSGKNNFAESSALRWL